MCITKRKVNRELKQYIIWSISHNEYVAYNAWKHTSDSD